MNEEPGDFWKSSGFGSLESFRWRRCRGCRRPTMPRTTQVGGSLLGGFEARRFVTEATYNG